MKIDFSNVMMKLDEMLRYAEGRCAGGVSLRPDERLSPMKDLLVNEMTYASQHYLSDEEWEDCFRDTARLADSELEFDADAIVSLGDEEGAYIQCWVWVSAGDARKEAQVRIDACNK